MTFRAALKSSTYATTPRLTAEAARMARTSPFLKTVREARRLIEQMERS